MMCVALSAYSRSQEVKVDLTYTSYGSNAELVTSTYYYSWGTSKTLYGLRKKGVVLEENYDKLLIDENVQVFVFCKGDDVVVYSFNGKEIARYNGNSKRKVRKVKVTVNSVIKNGKSCTAVELDIIRSGWPWQDLADLTDHLRLATLYRENGVLYNIRAK